VVTGKEREVVEAARKQRHERIANIFLRLREILARPRSDVPVTAGANNLARLAAAFDRWLRAHVNPEIVGNSDTLRRAAAKLTRELIEFLKAFRV
jgi:GrpB-like predicted nucleotidyltransferase (UPF0157 family)